jgi:hypothetical protein
VAWVKLDDSFWSHPKVMAAGNEIAGAYVRMLCYSASHLTDGRVPEEAARVIAKQRTLDLLQEFSFIEANGTGFVIPDYLDFNPSREKVLEERRKAAERQAKSREKSQRD